LDISKNEIKSLPWQIGDCKALRKLDIRKTHIEVLPFELSKCPYLKILH